jgi:tetratricopeptide (TPR) repeat protein
MLVTHATRRGIIGWLPVLLAFSAASTVAAAAQTPHHAGHAVASPADSVPIYDNLGSHHYEISSRVPAVQAYFDQGLRLYYAFNHAEAIRAFEEAARRDSTCAICYAGKALALGPNINVPMDSANAVQAYEAIQKALANSASASARERALIDALSIRYAKVPPSDRAPLDSAYARAMEALATRYPDDNEIATLHAESLMDLRPWQYWTVDGKPQPGIDRALASLERVTSRNPNHPGACHFYIHAVEEVYPRRAVVCAERLAMQMPGAGHLVHMPGHIYIRVGRYLDAIKANEHATHADETYIRDQGPGAGVYTLGYYPHNYDFLAFAASMIGRERQAVESAEKMGEIVPQEMAGTQGLTFMQHHLTRALQLYARFERWDDILRAPEPAQGLPHARMMWQYARGRALAATNDLPGAEVALERVREAMRDTTLATMRLEFNSSLSVAKIAEGVLAGRIAAARGDFTAAAAHLRRAADAEAALVYGEPPEWTVPVHQELGAVLLAAKRPADAEQAFRKDLDRFPDNGWSLYGLAESLRAQGKTGAADEALAAYRKAWEGTEPPFELGASR